MKPKKLLIIMSMLMIFGCTSAQTGATGDYSIYHSGKEFSKAAFGAKVFNSESEYESFLMGRSIKKNSLLNNLNFEKHSLVVAYLGKRAEDGYGLKILNVTVNTDKVMVTAKVVQADEKNAPHQFIVIEKTDKKAELRLE